MDIKNQKISLFGSGKTTKAIANWLSSKYSSTEITFFEDIGKSYIDKDGFLHLPSKEFNPKNFTLEIPSPGIAPHHYLIKKAKNLISEYDLFFPYQPFTIWVSGTNGKTTLTQMLTHLLKRRDAVSGGNIGTPLAELKKDAKIWILETSSFTLHYTKYAKPNIYLLLPITEDHTSWHGSFMEYENAKLKPIRALREGEVCIIPKKYEDIKTNGYKIVYEDSKTLMEFFNIERDRLKFKEPFLLDALLALSVTKILFDEIDYELLNSFKIDSHKLEEFYDKRGRLWVDDSKATNIDATIWAVKRYKDKKIHLILGGDAKGADLEPLFQFLKDFDITIYAIGKESENVESLSKKYNIECRKTTYLNETIKKIDKELKKDEIAILSPACASLDQFNSYKERGDRFKKIVLTLK